MSKREAYEFEAAPEGARPLWRSLEAKANPEAVLAEATAEFSRETVNGSLIDESSLVTRRGFLTLSSASAALVAAGCVRRPVEKILPFSKAPEYVVPGIAIHFATVREHLGEAHGLTVLSHEGRPTKIEGNELHPAGEGGTDLASQASIMGLYDPDRSKHVTRRNGDAAVTSSYGDFTAALGEQLKKHGAGRGTGLRLLMQPTSSPTLIRLRNELLQRFPEAKVHFYAPVNTQNEREGARVALGAPYTALVDYGAAKVVLAIDSDFLGTGSGSLRAARGFANGRRLKSAKDGMSRLYAVESTYTLTGAKADHRLKLPAQDIGAYLRVLAQKLSGLGVDLGEGVVASLGSGEVPGVSAAWIEGVAKDLKAHAGEAVVTVGERQPAWVHALAHAVNRGLGNIGRSIRYTESVSIEGAEAPPDIASLATDLNAGKVQTLLILGGNPVYDAPNDVGFAGALAKAAFSAHLSLYADETSALTTWHVPGTHYLEAWGDARSVDGTMSIQQPLIAPLYDGKSELELLSLVLGSKLSAHETVRSTLKHMVGDGPGFENRWRESLRRGIVTEVPRFSDATTTLFGAAIAKAVSEATAAKPAALSAQNLEVVFTPCPKLVDGRFANNPWLLEVPDSLTKIVWDNVALISSKTARALGVQGDAKRSDIIRISREGGGDIEVAVWELPGHADNSITLALGWGRTKAGRYGNGQGFDVNPLRTTKAFWFGSGAKVTKTGRTYFISQTQEHGSMEGRAIVLEESLAGYQTNPKFASYAAVEMSPKPLWKEQEYTGHKWGLSIDLTTCTGCNTCVVACQAENNIPNVGKRQVSRGREMYWLRIDRYFVGDDAENPQVSTQPIACQQCEEAPCENVCPVNATTHSPEGLNDMAYNRCIGTRYCMNNCPYKVRRFNFLAWHGRLANGGVDAEGGTPVLSPGVDGVPESERMQFNPNVTVRSRGVMEKCTYCVQRIQEVKIKAKREDRRAIVDGEIKTACAQACPTQAIVFGDLNDKNSRVRAEHDRDRTYHLLAELGTQPRTAFLAQIRNPNPEMES